MKHVQLFEQFIGEAAKSALGKDIVKNKKLFKEVVDALLPLAQDRDDNVSIADVEEWLEQDADSNSTFDYLEDLGFSVDGFFEYFDN
jgi:hypothetical protein